MRNLLTRDRLTSLIAAPVIWAAHFLFCYILVSLDCAYGFPGVYLAIGAATLLALALIGWIAWANYRKWLAARGTGQPGSDVGRFFSLNSMLLCVVSAVSLVWVAFPAVLLPTCAS